MVTSCRNLCLFIMDDGLTLFDKLKILPADSYRLSDFDDIDLEGAIYQIYQ